jgi:hypothetical protein
MIIIHVVKILLPPGSNCRRAGFRIPALELNPKHIGKLVPTANDPTRYRRICEEMKVVRHKTFLRQIDGLYLSHTSL